MKRLVAITGGIGSGKSEVLRGIALLDYPTLSADDINRELLEDEHYLSLLKANFKDAFDDTKLNKKKLAEIIFDNEERRLLLNSIAHKRIRAIVEEKAEQIDSNIVFVEVPLLIESGMQDMFDEVIVVISNANDRIKRVEKRDNIDSDAVTKRIKSQIADDELLKYATYVIHNDGTIDELREKIKDTISKINN